jgi:hypothetical protein
MDLVGDSGDQAAQEVGVDGARNACSPKEACQDGAVEVSLDLPWESGELF